MKEYLFSAKPGLHSFCKGKKNFFSTVISLWRVQGGFRFPPLEPSKPPVTPLKRPLWGLTAPGVAPPPISPPKSANMMFPIGLAVLASIRPSFSWGTLFPLYQTVSAPGEAGCGRSPVKRLRHSPGTGRKSAIFAPLVALCAPSLGVSPR